MEMESHLYSCRTACFFFIRPVLQVRSISASTITMAAQYYPFGHHNISESEVFYTTQLSFAFVNNPPVRPGPQKVGGLLESHHNASSLVFGIQDGPQAGQTVVHIHIHIIPRNAGDFENNDDAYETDLKEKKLKRKLDEDPRQIRSLADMAAEADEYRKLLC